MHAIVDIATAKSLYRTPRDLGAGLRQHRKALGLTQAEVAVRAHIRRPTLSALERGGNVTLSNVFRVILALDLSVQITDYRLDAQTLGAVFAEFRKEFGDED